MNAMKNTKKQNLAEKLLDYKPRSKEDLAYLDKFFIICRKNWKINYRRDYGTQKKVLGTSNWNS